MFYYMVMTAIRDVATQKNGLVFIGYNMEKTCVVDRTAAWCVSQMRKILPMRIIGMHYCYDDFRMRPMMAVAMLVMGGANRVRFRAHYGKNQTSAGNIEKQNTKIRPNILIFQKTIF
jgi:hypothetical protein